MHDWTFEPLIEKLKAALAEIEHGPDAPFDPGHSAVTGTHEGRNPPRGSFAHEHPAMDPQDEVRGGLALRRQEARRRLSAGSYSGHDASVRREGATAGTAAPEAHAYPLRPARADVAGARGRRRTGR
jgi:hypothetical protein